MPTGPIESLERTAATLSRRIAELHSAGFRSVGINVLVTLGHGDVPGGFLPPLSVPPAVGHDGIVSMSCVCPNSAAFRSYIKQRYALMARAGCVKKFGRVADRVSLVKQLNAPQNGALRREWSEFMAASL
jgi:hypothetical protein